MEYKLLFIYFLSFCSIGLFVYASYRTIREIQHIPIEEEGWAGGMGRSSLDKNPLYRFSMLVVRGIARLNIHWNISAYEAILKRKVDGAGRPMDLKPTEFLALKEICALLFVFIGIVVFILGKKGFSLFFVPPMALLGFMLPNVWINDLIRRRRLFFLLDLPFCCDLLTLAVEAGLDFGTALEKVVASGPPGPLRDEFHQVLQEMKIGKTRREALQNMADRIQMVEISHFVGAIVQGDRLGTGFGPILRIQSAQVRNSRFERAEKAAQKAPIKILFPIIIVNILSMGVVLVIPLLTTIGSIGL